jgi:hypothetical protein
LILPLTIAKPMRAVGGFFALALDTMVQMFKPPFAFREFLLQTWFIARACADDHVVDSVHRHGGVGNVSGRKSQKRPSLFGRALFSHSALVDRVDRRHRPTSPVSKRLEV